jgi:hypothetical protein
MASTVAQGAHQRVFFNSKAEWAEARAKELRAEATRLRYQPSFGQTIRAMRKFNAVSDLQREAARFERMAAAFRKKGV